MNDSRDIYIPNWLFPKTTCIGEKKNELLGLFWIQLYLE